ncbi:MAG: uroporphyrinogen-III C-methyltransferase [Pseudomonadota bacterium]
MPDAPGKVWLVGAGPGAADLMTVRAQDRVRGAQALLYDALVSAEAVDLAPPGCIRIETGKRAGRAGMRQETINRLMLRLARRGLAVVRLKGGDPSVFGRVGEEAAFLRAHGIDCEVVPGVTAASAAAAQFGFPLTHRGEARRLLIATATTGDGALTAEGWAAAADPQTTLALYMGRDQLAAAVTRLIDQGRAPDTPAVAVENAGRADARALAGSLGELAGRLGRRAADGPVVVIVGAVVARAAAREIAAAFAPRGRPPRPAACARRTS